MKKNTPNSDIIKKLRSIEREIRLIEGLGPSSPFWGELPELQQEAKKIRAQLPNER